MKGISSTGQSERRNQGWFVRLTCKRRMFPAFCSNRKCGGRSKALANSRALYAEMVEEHARMLRKEFSRIPRRPASTRIAGVTKLARVVGGKKYAYWQARWNSKSGRTARKTFSIARYGEAKAKRLAIQARKAALAKWM